MNTNIPLHVAHYQQPEVKTNHQSIDELEHLSEFELARQCSKTWSMGQD